MQIDLSDLKIGDKVFHSQFGEDKVIGIQPQMDFISHTKEGKLIMRDIADCKLDGTMWQQGQPKHPSVFHSVTECIAYFNYIAKCDSLASRIKMDIKA